LSHRAKNTFKKWLSKYIEYDLDQDIFNLLSVSGKMIYYKMLKKYINEGGIEEGLEEHEIQECLETHFVGHLV
jgi:site-specific recombinase XerC